MRILVSIVALSVFLIAPIPAGAVDAKNSVDIKEWKVPFGGHSRDPYAESSNSVWFVGQRGDYLARFDPVTGKFTRRALDDSAGPHNLIVARDGTVWYSGNLRGYIGRHDPGTGEIEKIRLPDSDARDPHTLVFDNREMHIWFTVQGGNFVGRLTIADRKVDLIPAQTGRSSPYGIIMAPDGTVWVALFGTNKLASVNPRTLKLTEHNLPDGARPRRIDVTSDGRIYYTDYRRGFLGRFDPRTKKLEEWRMPSGHSARPYGMAVDAKDRVWFVETGPSPNTFVGFAPDQGRFHSITPIPSGAGSVRHMHYHAPTGTVWSGTDEDTVGRAVVGK